MSPEVTLAFVFVSAAALAFAALAWWRAAQKRHSMVSALRGKRAEGTLNTLSGRQPKSRLARFGRLVTRGTPSDSKLRLKLARAGWDSRTAPLTYSAARFWLAISVPLIIMTMAYGANRSIQEIAIVGISGLIVAWLIPTLVVQRRGRLRAKRIQKSLPDALDLMVVCVEAGVGVDAAILRVSDELQTTHQDIAHEFQVVNQQVNAGIPRIEALRQMVARSGVDDLRAVVSTLIQSEKLGVSIGHVLRVSGDALRTKRRQTAEQAARKAPIKMLVPLILFILPALMLVIIGPAAINLVRVLRTAAP